jgi:hypothetical protein
MTKWTVPPLWEGGECWIIGGGASMPRQFGVPEEIIKKVSSGQLEASAYSPYLSTIHNKHVIGINNAYTIGNWIDICFFGDCGWWLVHQSKLAKFPGMKITCCPRFANRSPKEMEGVKYLRKDNLCKDGITTKPDAVAWNNNSGCASISLAAHLGVKRIILLGFDMSFDKQNVSHWFGSHHPGRAKNKPINIPFPRHMRGIPAIVKHANQRGIEILNASDHSAIREFKVVKVNELLANTTDVAQ